MSVQFGRWNFKGKPFNAEETSRVDTMLAPYGPDGGNAHSLPGIYIFYRAFHTTAESRRETQPCVTASGDVLTWDGRLDNRQELIERIGDQLSGDTPDVEIVCGAYEQWGMDSFGKLIGDWALSIWSPKHRTLILAKDFSGIRPLYYFASYEEVLWTSILDPLVLLSGRSFTLDFEYVAGWISNSPDVQHTPYAGISSVPPGSYVRFRNGCVISSRYWDFNPEKRFRYSTDAEYEEHFRCVFRQSVRRRLQSDAPVVAELSGGLDSSSIVCVADDLLHENPSGSHPSLHTISYYSDSEPDWNEQPYFAKVEQRRGRTGCHVDVSSATNVRPGYRKGLFAATPNSNLNSTVSRRQFAHWFGLVGSRIVLSGTGGDEVTGGVSTPLPALADLVAGARFRTLAHELKVWALQIRKPWIYLLIETLLCFLPSFVAVRVRTGQRFFWLNAQFRKRHRAALAGYPRRWSLFAPLPSFAGRRSALDSVRRQLACSCTSCEPPYDKRYPYLDRDLLEFLFAIPRDQLVRPGQRRSLMRRALAGIVPDEILYRRRKAFVTRTPTLALANFLRQRSDVSSDPVLVRWRIVDGDALADALRKVQQGFEIDLTSLAHTVAMEDWLAHNKDWDYLKPSRRTPAGRVQESGHALISTARENSI